MPEEFTFEKGFGWKPDLPDFRDFKLGNSFDVLSLSKLPQQHSNMATQSPIRDQRRLGSCTGFAVTAAIEQLRRQDEDDWSTIYSPLFMYLEVRRLEGTLPADAGAYMRSTVKVANKTGCPPESAWKYYYEEVHFNETPPEHVYKSAARWKLGPYHRCSTLEEILTALTQKIPVIGGFSVYSSLNTNQVWRTGDVPMPSSTDRLLGGHAILYVGYDQATRRVQFKNSWGTDWGNKGYGTLPFDYLANPQLSGDHWALTREA